jgi:hypothetical protein
MSHPDVLRVRAEVELIPSDELDALEPARHAIVEITRNDGIVDRGEVVRKATDLTEPVLGNANSAGLIEKLTRLEKLNDLRGLRPFLQKA